MRSESIGRVVKVQINRRVRIVQGLRNKMGVLNEYGVGKVGVKSFSFETRRSTSLVFFLSRNRSEKWSIGVKVSQSLREVEITVYSRPKTTEEN